MEKCPECEQIGLCYDPRIQRPRCTMCHWKGGEMTDDKYYEEYQKDSEFYAQKIPHFNPEFSYKKIDPLYEYDEHE